MHEIELIENLSKGSEQAFYALILSYQDRVFNTALGIVQNREDAEEIAQDVFISAWQNIGKFRQQSSLSTWIYRIAITRSLDHVKKKNRQKRGGLFRRAIMENEDGPMDFDHPGILAENRENAKLLFMALQQLPAQQKAAFVLQKLEGLSQAEIATILDTTVSAVESLLHRARAGLRLWLEKNVKNEL